MERVQVDRADVVIVGGGIVGSAVAYFLSTADGAAGRRVVIVERDPGYAEASTARSLSVIATERAWSATIAKS